MPRVDRRPEASLARRSPPHPISPATHRILCAVAHRRQTGATEADMLAAADLPELNARRAVTAARLGGFLARSPVDGRWRLTALGRAHV